jgi:hypothetical protein
MKYEPYKETIRSIVIAELTQSGWVDLIRIPLDDPHKATPESIQEAIEQLRDMIFKNDKIYMDVQGEAVCVKGMERGKTLKVYAGKY